MTSPRMMLKYCGLTKDKYGQAIVFFSIIYKT